MKVNLQGAAALTDYKEQGPYRAHLAAYATMFSEMTVMGRSIWFFTADEAEILSFDVGPDQTVEDAAMHHAIKLCAMADALASIQVGGPQDSIIAELRKLAAQHWADLVNEKDVR